MSEKIKIEISLATFDKIKKIYEQSKDIYEKMNLSSVDDFITYILENFSNSSIQFDKLNDQMKSLMENINLDNLNFEDLFKSIAKTSMQKDENKKEENKVEDNPEKIKN
ncbi:hypothetical protein D8X55_00840 [Malacoplasma penetrans]|uniref:Uncharacterized protein n=1 Tax=Malacoplasma penetrans (strain HF-2) TaxID=272633 RepID=Q8EVX0_MALP2|nr:hypothetical protein [Malacoplasma penetrans]RXY97231.1 hypothetical protein D8X55_00840 [Malacoplasma penetrans]BAC44229.1 hypothetical protein [Malacoplasma penetrans HF-2]